MRGPRLLPLCLVLIVPSLAAAQPEQTPAQPNSPAEAIATDTRLGELIDLNGHFPFDPPATVAQWRERRESLRRRLQVLLGLWPMPTKHPLEPVIHGRVEKDGYTVEKVYFQSMPGFFVTGNLYRPTGAATKRPGILCPHGHWPNGRFYDTGAQQVRQLIEGGAEQFEQGGRNPIQARCVQLARMGCVVFNYDMIGYADSQQISQQIAHGFSEPRPEMHSPNNWGLFSPQAESRFQHVMGLQTYSSIRALDFLCQLPDVDTTRLAVTGASGGGTQTFILCALDDRPAAAFPAVMVSTHMQGGCTCENACGLRIVTGNVEIAGLFAPKPLGMTAADDWTKEMAEDGFPQLQKLYRLLGAPDHVMLTSLTQFPHNYNWPSRMAMYEWFNTHLHLGVDEPIVERDYDRLTRDELTVWDEDHPKPSSGPDFERSLLHWWHSDAQQQIRARLPAADTAGTAAAGEASIEPLRELLRPAMEAIIGRTVPDAARIDWQPSETRGQSSWEEQVGRAVYRPDPSQQEVIHCVILRPERPRAVVLWISQNGKQDLAPNGQLRPEVRSLLDERCAVIGIDLFWQGESLGPERSDQHTRRVDNPRAFAGYTFGYNHSVFAQRTHDVLTAAALARKLFPEPLPLAVVAVEGAGRWGAAARAVAPSAIDLAVLDLAGFRFDQIDRLDHPDFLPGGAKYADVGGMLLAAAPQPVIVQGLTSDDHPTLQAAYQVAGQADALVLAGDEGPGELVRRLIEQLGTSSRRRR